MKSILSFLFLLAIGIQLNAQTNIVISGNVADASTSLGVDNHLVQVYADSVSGWTYTSSTQTDTFGDYAFSISIPQNISNATFHLVTLNCNNQSVSQTVYFPDTLNSYIANFSICVGSPTNCTTQFIYYQDSTAPLTFYFYSQNTGVTYQWSFGDGTTSTLQNPIHTYASHGIYQVTLTTTDASLNCTDSKTISLQTTPSACTASFTLSPDPNDNMKVNLAASYVGSLTTYNWDFGDQSTGTGQTTSHTYTANGLYNITLTVADSVIGCSSQHSEYVLIPTDTQCISHFYYSTYDLKAHFWTDTIHPSASYIWVFGDGDTLGTSMPDASHTYSAYGTYNVCLTITTPASTCTQYCQNITLTMSSPVNKGYIYGTVYTGNTFADYATVYLIEHDSVKGTLKKIDQYQVDSGGMYTFEADFGQYLLKAALKKKSSVYTNYMPTYYDTALFWDLATPIYLHAYNRYQMIDINMVSGTNHGGPGFIGGKITNGARSEENGVAEVLVLLLDQYENAIAYTYSDDQGAFEFKDLALGSYTVFAEVTGLDYEGMSTTLDNENTSSTDIRFYVNETTITSGLAENVSPQIRSIGHVYPNPSIDNINLNVVLLEPTTLSFIITNQLGQKVYTKEEKLQTGLNQIRIDGQQFFPGAYFLIIQAEDGLQLNRKFIKTK